MYGVYLFSDDKVVIDKNLLGNKGANLVNLYRHGINVPLGFIISSDICKEYMESSAKGISIQQQKYVDTMLKKLSEATGKEINGQANPLIVSVRSGASVSMPGMLSTILNVGITEKLLETKNEKYLYEAYIRFIDGFGKTVYDISLEPDDNLYNENSHYRSMIAKKKKLFYELTHTHLEDDMYHNLEKAIMGIFNSWNGKNAVAYRKLKGIPDDIYTAVVVQEMKFGNYNTNSSGSGVVFTINPFSKKEGLYGEYIDGCQGEDIVSGVKDTKSIETLKEENEEIYNKLTEQVQKIQKLYAVPQDIEFTYEDGEVYILQTRDVRI